jgi:hypothetical protein
MTTVLTARPPRREPAIPAPEEVIERARARVCSVVTFSESVLFRRPWAGLRPQLRALPASDARRPSTPRASAPGTSERLLFRALEWMAVERSVARGTPFENPMIVHPRDLCERLCWRATLPQFIAIERSLQALTSARVAERDGAPPSGVLRSATPDARRASPAAICPSYYVTFDDRFVASINAGNLIPVNWSLWVALHDPIARRLLEVLEADWPTQAKIGTASFSVDSLAERVPLPAELGAAQHRALLERAHEELIAQEYLTAVHPISLERFRYHPGSTFQAMRLRLPQARERLLRERIRTGWALGSGVACSRSGHNIRRAASSP